MRKMVDNRYVKEGYCKYEDDYGNIITLRRVDDNVFTAKLRFMEKPYLKTNVIRFDISSKDEQANAEMGKLEITCEDSTKNIKSEITVPAIESGISCLMELVVHWENMFKSLKMVSVPNNYVMQSNTDFTSEEQVIYAKAKILEQYEELKEVVDTFL